MPVQNSRKLWIRFMSRLIESIRLEHGRYARLAYHQQRVSRSFATIYPDYQIIDLEAYLSSIGHPAQGLYKCRIVYDQEGIHRAEFIPYVPSPVRSLRVLHADTINYEMKWERRDGINRLFELRGDQDDILIIRNGYVTDTSYANVVFSDGTIQVTPAQPLLQGTMRQCLLDAGEIREEEIFLRDISKFKTIQLMNAMLEFQSPPFPVSNIVT